VIVDYSDIGEHLRKLREERHLGIRDAILRMEQDGVAIWFGDNRKDCWWTLTGIERGATPATIAQLKGLARIYGVYLEIGVGAFSVSW
jgi:hypothetical protein